MVITAVFCIPGALGKPRVLLVLLTSCPESLPQASESVAEVTSSYIQGKKRLVQKDNLIPSTATGLAVVPVKVRSPDLNKAVTTCAFLDTGSTASFCSEEFANQLGLSGRVTLLSLTTMEKEDIKARVP